MTTQRLLVCASLFASVMLNAQKADSTFWRVDGPVYAMDQSGDTLYVGGSFSHMGPAVFNLCRIDTITGEPDLLFPQTESSSEIIADGHGGFIYQGNGASAHPEYSFVGRIDNTGSVQQNWPASWPGTSILSPSFPRLVYHDQIYFGDVNGMIGDQVNPGFSCDTSGSINWNMPEVDGLIRWSAPDGSGGIFIGGIFSMVNGLPRSGIAHLDANGALTPFHPIVKGSVNDAIRLGNFVYFSGSFEKVNGQSITGLAKVSFTSGATAPGWAFQIAGTLASINSLDTAGGILYLGGIFTQANLQFRNNLAAIDLATDQLTTWAPSPNNTVNVVRTNGGTIYVGGDFTSVGATRNRLAALDAAGTTLAWNPSCSSGVTGISFGNNAVYIWGKFITVGTATRRYAAQIDPVTGLANAWNLNIPVMTLSAYDRVCGIYEMNNKVFVAGRFVTINAQSVNYISTVTTSGTLVTTNVSVSSFVTTINPLSPTSLFVAGDFTSINPMQRLAYARADLSTGLLNSWAPRLTGTGNPGVMLAYDTVIILTGSFNEINDSTRMYIAAVDTGTGDLTSFYPQVNGNIDNAWLDGSVLYIHGSFTTVNSIARNGLAGIDLITGTVTAFNPSFNSSVYELTFSSQRIFVSGNFTTASSQPQAYLAAFDKTTGAFDAGWRPVINGPVDNLTCDGNLVYAEGAFTTVNGEERKGMVSINATTAQLGSLDVSFSGGNPWTLAIMDHYLVVAGVFGTVGYEPCSNIAAFSFTTGEPIPFASGTNGPVRSLKLSGQNLYAGGTFSQVDALPITNLAAFNRSTGAVYPAFAPQPDNTVECILPDGNDLFIGGSFSNVNVTNHPYLAKLNSAGALLPFNAAPNGVVYALAKQGSRIFVGGSFSQCGGQPRNNIAALTTTAVATPWNPNADNIVRDIYPAGNLIYACGDFFTINGQNRPSTAALDGTTAVPTSWTPPFSFSTSNYSILPDGNDVYVGGDFNSFLGGMYNLVIAMDRYNASYGDWNAGQNISYSSTYYAKQLMMTPRGLAVAGMINGTIDQRAWGFIFMETNRQSTISGNVFMDINTDSVNNAGDFPMSNVWVTDGTGNGGQLTNMAGNWSVYLDSGQYTYAPLIPYPYMVSFPGNYQFSFSANNQIDTGGIFAMQFLDSVVDLQTHIISYGPVRPGSNYAYECNWSNVGTATLNPLLVIHMDTLLVIDSVVPAPSFANGDSLAWNMSSISPGMAGLIHVYVSVPTTAINGDTVNCSVYISPVSGDTVPWNNIDSLHRIVTGSYDPNIKEVTPADSVVDMSTAFLSYQVQFQNTGTDTALIIVVRDTLDVNLDPTTIMILGATHPYVASVTGNILTMTFNNIMLPDSATNELESHGCFRYRIAVDPGITPGTVISNSAAIYFDYNDPVVTNTTSTIFDTLIILELQPEEYESSGFLLYPNPSDESVNLWYLTDGPMNTIAITITDVSGRTVFFSRTNQQATTIDISQLSGGCYFVNVEDSSGRKGIQRLLVK